MMLLTKELRERLLKNGRERGKDHVPVVKFFNPCGAATWLFTELDSDGDTLFGLADLGMGCVEMGAVSLKELESITVPPFGLKLERDRHWKGKYPLSVYFAASDPLDRLVDGGAELEAAAKAMGFGKFGAGTDPRGEAAGHKAVNKALSDGEFLEHCIQADMKAMAGIPGIQVIRVSKPKTEN